MIIRSAHHASPLPSPLSHVLIVMTNAALQTFQCVFSVFAAVHSGVG